MRELSTLQTLADLLRGGGAQPVVLPERLAPSTIYDLQYRLVVNACAFESHAKSDLIGTRRIQAARLKLLQFVAIRPWLMPVMRQWSASQGDPDLALSTSQPVRHGFLGDAMHDRVVEFLVAHDVLVRIGGHLVSGKGGSVLGTLASTAVATQLFEAERTVLKELANVRITNTMLEGA